MYNAINESNYINEDDLEFTILEDEEYSIFIQCVGEYNKSTKNLTEAVNRAVDGCIRDGILIDILENQKKEVINVVLTEFDEEKFEAMIRKEGHEEGRILTLFELVSDGIISMEEAENIWGREQAMEYYENLTLYYEEIKGVTATYQDTYIEPVYHRLSAGATRPGETTLGEVYGYLQSAASRMDIESKAYLHTKKLSYEELTNALSTHITKDSLWIVHSDEVGYVDKISVNNKEMTGEEFRKKCQLNSANFTMLENEVGVVFTIKGEGHGYGLSQYGANRMAAEGKSYEETAFDRTSHARFGDYRRGLYRDSRRARRKRDQGDHHRHLRLVRRVHLYC